MELPNALKQEQPYKRRRLAAYVAAVTLGALVVGGPKAIHAIGKNESVIYTQQQYQEFHKEPVVLQPGEGADGAIRDAHEPAILANAEMKAEVDSFIQSQGQGPGHELLSGQVVEVPVPPKIPNN